jgi:hypothetical protein
VFGKHATDFYASPAAMCCPAAVWDGLRLQLTELLFVLFLLCFSHLIVVVDLFDRVLS